MHSECLTGDVFGSQRCDCGAQLDAAMAAIAERGRGVVLYLRGHEGRGIGLLTKLQAYELQDAGADTVDANLELGLPVDAREYSVAAQLLDDLGVRSVRLLTNNPAKVAALAEHGFGVTRIPLPPLTTPYNLRYLTTKRDRLGPPDIGDLVPRAPADPTRFQESEPDERRRTATARRSSTPRTWRSRSRAPGGTPEITDSLVERADRRRQGLRRRATCSWSGWPARSSCPSSPRSWPGTTTRWSASARSSAAARRTSSTSATR